MKKEMVGEMSGSVLGMMADLSLKLQHGVITPGQLGRFLRKENPFGADDYHEVLINWQLFYKKLFGSDYDFSNIRIPERPQGNWRLLIITDITLEILYARCKELFPCWRWTNGDFDKIVTENERTVKNGPYAIWTKDVVEADENLKNNSANDIKAKGITTETLTERLIHELKFFDETGKHLDIKNITLCSGSCGGGGSVPGVHWGGAFMNVYWYYPDYRNDDLRPRQAVS